MRETEVPKSTLALRAAFKRKMKLKASYSQSAFARDLGVSSAFVTNILTGKKLLPPERVALAAKILELDQNERRELVQALLVDREANPDFKKLIKSSLGSPEATTNRKTLRTSDDLVSSWKTIAILEALSTAIGQKSYEKLPKFLGISQTDFERALKFLFDQELIKQTPNGFKKVDDHLYMATGRSKASIRSFHLQLIEKAKTELTEKANDYDFARRLITGFTFSANAENVDRMKSRIQDFLNDLSFEAGDGDCTDVYQCNIQFFPLSDRRKL